jgi:hypothetical protein
MFNKINPIVLLFAAFSTSLLIAGKWINNMGLDTEFLIGTNIFIFILSLVTMYMQTKALRHSNPNVFVRAVMGSMLLKMMVCVIAVLIFVTLDIKKIGSGDIFSFMFLYLIYLFIEVKSIMSRNKKANA